MFESVLIAARGLIACRAGATLQRLGIRVIAVHSEADRHAAHVLLADRAVCIGASPVDSYANGAAILDAARIAGAAAIHPGAGSLGANADFARATEKLGLVFLGPTPEQLQLLGDATRTRELAREAGVPTFSEGAVQHARRVRVQLFGDGRGQVLELGEQDCSAGRKGTTLLAESPAPNLPRGLRERLVESALALTRRVDYRSAGSAEFVYDADRSEPFLVAFHPRLCVEHALAEALFDVDLVEWMLLTGAGHPPSFANVVRPIGAHAIQARLYAEDPSREFQRTSGTLTALDFPSEVRADLACAPGDSITEDIDPLLGSIVVCGNTRAAAHVNLQQALARLRIGGMETNVPYLSQIVRDPLFAAGELTTRSLERVAPESAGIEVLSAGPSSIVVDYPGRLRYWAVGIPPSGPMDPLAHRLANRVVGNPEHSATLELTLAGPKLKFRGEAMIALSGARMSATLDGDAIQPNRPIRVRPGQVLAIGNVEGPGCRSYLAIRGGLDVPSYLGSKTTFTLGGFGGHAGRALRPSDTLHVGTDEPLGAPAALPPELVPLYDRRWQIGVAYGPHGAPDFFTERDISTLFATEWEVHFNSNRTGVRLIGPKPEWARSDGGEAGLHPSNIHDVAYAVGAIDFTGDMPILLGPDGPSLGGFVCPATVVDAELWKLGQLKAGDRVRFVPITLENAAALEQAQVHGIATLQASAPVRLSPVPPRDAVLGRTEESAERVAVVYRRSGDKYLLVEYGPL
ncbi:MAG TPA: 5-oxoprolinase/urea amidolyase family protein, partial [Polyangiaceae bacterium]